MGLVIEVPTGAIDGVNRVFTVSQAYVAGSARHLYNGMPIAPEGEDGLEETSPSLGTVTLKEAPQVNDSIEIMYDDGQDFRPVMRIRVRAQLRTYEMSELYPAPWPNPEVRVPTQADRAKVEQRQPISLTYGDTAPIILLEVMDETGKPLNLANHLLHLKLRWFGELDLINPLAADQLCTLLSTSSGLATFTLTDSQSTSLLTRVGLLDAALRITFPDSLKFTVYRWLRFKVNPIIG